MEVTSAIPDYLVIVLYLGLVFIVAYISSKKVQSTNYINNQYLAGQSLTTMESLSSIIATEVSALTFLGIPAFAFGSDFSFVQIYMGATFGRIVIAYVMLPKIYNQGLTVYSVMGKIGQNSNGQKYVAIFYAINKFLAVGVRLFSGSILVSHFFDLNIYSAIFIICALTFCYTLVGGLKAVVRTDMIQMFLFILGGVAAHFIIPQIAGSSWGDLMSAASSAGKTSFFDFSNPSSFIIGILGGFLFDMSTHGVDQDFVQRLTGNRTLKGAQRAIVCSSFISISIGFLFLGIGALLWSFYQVHPAPDLPADKIFAHFITEYFPAGLKGLMVAGVLAATMSTLDSTINALSSCLYNDIFKHKAKNKKEISKFYQKDTLIITIGLMLIAFIASKSDQLLLLGLKITSWTAGSLITLFFLTVVWKKIRLSPLNVIVAYAFGILAVYLNTYHFKLNWNFNVYLGALFSAIASLCTEKIQQQRDVNDNNVN